jgi:hypothetical protein
MNEPPVTRKTLIGVIPMGQDVHLFGEDIGRAARLLDDANANLDAARAAEAKALAAKFADEARVKLTRRARAARRLKRALRMVLR